jgi:DNA-binding Lrp family transcriptional regulator
LLETSFFGSKPFYFVEEFKEQFKNEGKIIRHDFKLYGRGEEKKQFQRFIDGKKNVLIITGAAGVGKTRFIIEMAEELQNKGVVPIFLRSDTEMQGDEILKISETKSRYAIFIDDAHDYSNAHSILKLASHKKYEQFKFILTTRIQLKDHIIVSANPEDLELLQLKPFPQTIMSGFLQNELKVTDSKIRLHIWQLTRGLPLFAILFADIIKEKKLQPLEITKDELIERWINKFLLDLEEGDNKNESDFLKVLAAVEPVSSKNEKLLAEISNFLNVPRYELERIINHLSELGYIKKFGRMIKINHDIIGNYLLYQTNVENPQLLSKIRDTFLKYELKNVSTNLAKAEYLGQNDLLSQFLEESLENIPSLSIPQRLRIVESLGTLAFFRPSEVLEIVKKIMRVPAGKYTDKHGIFGEVDLTNENVLKEVPPVLRNVSFSFENLEVAMNLLNPNSASF